MIFKTKKYYKKRVKDLEFQNYCWQITLQDTIEESEQLKSEIVRLKSEIEQLKSEKTMLHERKQIEVETDYINPIEYVLYNRLKHKVLTEIENNFDKYVKVSPIIECPRECKCKQYATILIERGF